MYIKKDEKSDRGELEACREAVDGLFHYRTILACESGVMGACR